MAIANIDLKGSERSAMVGLELDLEGFAEYLFI